MPTKDEFLPSELQCIDNGHRFTKQVWNKVHYAEEGGEPLFSTIPRLGEVRCPAPGCGSLAKEAED